MNNNIFVHKIFAAIALVGAAVFVFCLTAAPAKATVLEDIQVIDITDPTALLVRKNGDTGNVFIVDTSSTLVTVNGRSIVNGQVDGVQLTVKGYSTQTANIFEVQDSSGTAVARFGTDANVQIGNGNFSYGALKIGGSVGLSSNIGLQIDRNFNSASAVYAVNGETLNSSAGDVYGLNYSARAHHGSGTMSNLVGLLSGWRATNAGTVTNAYSLKTSAGQVSGGATVTNGYGLYVDSQTLATNDYGVYIKNADTYALWSDAGKNRFDDTSYFGFGTKTDGYVIVPAGEVQTTNNTTTTLLTIPLTASSTYHFTAQVTALSTAGAAASYEIDATVVRKSSGVTLVRQAKVYEGETSSGWDAVFEVSGTDILLRVVGASATTIQWAGSVQYLNVREQ